MAKEGSVSHPYAVLGGKGGMKGNFTFISGSNREWGNELMVPGGFANYFAAFSPECDNIFNVLPLAAQKPWK